MNPFVKIIESLNRHGVRYVVVGGVAAVLHGVDRTTRDLDLVVDLRAEEARKAIDALVSLGLQSRVPIDPYQFADAGQRRRWIDEKGAVVFTLVDPDNPLFVVDLFVESPVEFEALFARAQWIPLKVDGVRVCSMEDLIALKCLSARPQDFLDIQMLESIRARGGGS